MILTFDKLSVYVSSIERTDCAKLIVGTILTDMFYRPRVLARLFELVFQILIISCRTQFSNFTLYEQNLIPSTWENALEYIAFILFVYFLHFIYYQTFVQSMPKNCICSSDLLCILPCTCYLSII